MPSGPRPFFPGAQKSSAEPQNPGRAQHGIRILAAAGTVLLLAHLLACVPASRSLDLPLQIPTGFSTSGEAVMPSRWWLALEDPTLHELIGRALAENFDLRTARDRLQQSEAAARRAGADLAPEVRGDAAGSRNYDSGPGAGGRNYSLGALAAYEVDLWGRLHSRREAATLGALASREDLQIAAITVSAQVASIWYQLVEQQGQLDLLSSQLEINHQVLELVSLRFRRGQTGAADVLQQRQLVQSNLGQQAQVRSRLAVLTHRLAILLGLPPGELNVPRISTLPELPPVPRTGLPAELIQRRPDLRRAHYRVLAASHQLAAAIADGFPRLSLAARTSTGGSEAGDIFSSWLTNVAANLAGPLLDGGRRSAEIDRTRAAAAEEIHSYGRVVLEALGEVEDGLAREARQQELIASLDQQLQLAEEASNLVRGRYLRGAESYLRVLDALSSQQGLQRNRLAAQRQLLQDRIDLYRALAGAWESG